jgi:hypothetical protein
MRSGRRSGGNGRETRNNALRRHYFGATPMDRLTEIRKLYFAATRATIERDFDRAVDLLKAMPTVEERERATVYMQGLAEMKKGWKSASPPKRPRR